MKKLKNVLFLLLFLFMIGIEYSLIINNRSSKFSVIFSFVHAMILEYLIIYIDIKFDTTLFFKTVLSKVNFYMYIFALQCILTIMFFNKFMLFLFYLDYCFIVSVDYINFIYKNYIYKLL